MNLQEVGGRIEAEYNARGYSSGWRLLYAPEATVLASEIAFIGLNPAGDRDRPDHPRLATVSGSAYEQEMWDEGAGPGRSKLQRQVRLLFDRLGERAEDILAGNLVPFRSASWSDLKDARIAVRFGQGIWAEILASSRPSLVITMGEEASQAVAGLLGVHWDTHVPIGWGTLASRAGTFHSGRLVTLPHLSRFSVIGRVQSEAALASLFGERWRPPALT